MPNTKTSLLRRFFLLLIAVYHAMGNMISLSLPPQEDSSDAYTIPEELQRPGIEQHFEAVWTLLGNAVKQHES